MWDIIHPDRRNLTAIRGYVRLGGLPDNPRTDPQDRAWFGPHDRLFTQEESVPIDFKPGPEYGEFSFFSSVLLASASAGCGVGEQRCADRASFRCVAFCRVQCGAGAGTARETWTGRTWTRFGRGCRTSRRGRTPSRSGTIAACFTSRCHRHGVSEADAVGTRGISALAWGKDGSGCGSRTLLNLRTHYVYTYTAHIVIVNLLSGLTFLSQDMPDS